MKQCKYFLTNKGVMFIDDDSYSSFYTNFNIVNGETKIERFGYTDKPKYYLARGVEQPLNIGNIQKVIEYDGYRLIDNIDQILPDYIDKSALKQKITAGEWTDLFDPVKGYYELVVAGEKEVYRDYGSPIEFVRVHKGIFHIEDEVPNAVVKYAYRDKYDFKDVDMSIMAASVISYDDFAKALNPGFMWHEGPCYISSNELYKIIRGHVKENIDGRFAEITSDYDFCFTIKKKIKLANPYERRDETKRWTGKQWKSYKPPRWTTTKIVTKSVEIFEMTNQTDRYKGYTPIEPIYGNSARELVDNLQRYLDELMEYVNKPLAECSCCGGTGHEEIKNVTPKGKVI